MGRNDACPCGSGRKYKRCCGSNSAAASLIRHGPQPVLQVPGGRAGLDQTDMSGLIDLVNQGKWNAVENRATALLRFGPTAGIVWKILSVALVKQRKDALPALERASELLPLDAEAHSNLGAVLLDRGRWADALTSFQRAIELQPNLTAALVHAADSLVALGRPQEALGLYQRAIGVNPALSEAHNNLANALYELGQNDDAIRFYRSALYLRPDDAAIHSNLANALRRTGNIEESITSARQAVSLQPGLATAHNNLGLSLAAQGRYDDACASYRQALALDGEYVDALNNLGNALRDRGDPGDGSERMKFYSRAIALDPRRADSHCNLGNLLFELRRIDEAVACYSTALSLDPGHVDAKLSLAMALRMQGRADEADAICRAALRSNPNNAEALSLLGELLADRGRFSEAQDVFQSVVALKPDFPFVYLSIAMHRKMTVDDTAWLKCMESLVTRRQPLRYEIALRYALGKYFDDTRQYDRAFENYRLANELTKRNGLVYDAAAMTRRVDQIIARFDSSSRRKDRSLGHASNRPVFVVGMPRSGTSLTEQILASHPRVFGAGELTFWDAAVNAFETTGQTTRDDHGRADAAVTEDLALAYLERLNRVAGDALRVVDKMPPNFMNLGLIHATFPNAKIIHMRRHPVDTCLSIYFQYFLSTHPYANDLQSLAQYYREYLRIMEHWRTYLPKGTLLEVQYESLIADQEGWTRRLIDFLDLPWDPCCLNFHQTDRVVITASKWQVRQTIHAGSAGRWKNYEMFAGPLLPLIELAKPG